MTPSARRRLTLVGVVGAACVAAIAQAASVGTVHDGALDGGYDLPLRGAHYRIWEQAEARGTHHATLEVAALLTAAARAVAGEHGGVDSTLVVGDISKRAGGRLYGHLSHRSGRDVDVLPYRLDRGRPVTARRFVPFDGRGRVRGTRLTFDAARNWTLVRSLVTSRYPAVQFVFVARPLRRLLLDHAAGRGELPEVLERARHILRQPRNSSAHSEHFHVRTYCSIRDLNAGCRDKGPRWPWIDEDGWAAPLDEVERGDEATPIAAQ